MPRTSNFPSTVSDVPRGPQLVSPPETELESTLASDNAHASRAGSDVGSLRARRAPSIFYKQPEMRDSRSQKATRWLIIVMPPALLDFDSHDDKSGTSSYHHRSSSGVLMPLFPTMYGQMTAIAREFSLPSTTGLSIYLHLPDLGHLSASPRVTDETWQMLWGHFFVSDDRAPIYPPHQLPIVSSRIEFDIDQTTAKWFAGWARSRGQSVNYDVASDFTFPNRGTAPTHVSQESVLGLQMPAAVRPNQHFRQLSLLERRARDMSSIPSSLRPSRAKPISELPLSEAPRSREPSSSPTTNLDTMVLNWRQKTPTAVVPSHVHSQHASESHWDTPNSPQESNLDDFSWSISSAGPLSYEIEDLLSFSPAIRSVHLADRVAGSVILTPSTATSWGPPSGPVSPAFSNASRYPSPDIAARMIEDAPYTPSTATSNVSLRTPDVVGHIHSPTASSFHHDLTQEASSDLLRNGLTSVKVRFEVVYPLFDIYPPAYPNLEIYPPSKLRAPPAVSSAIVVTLRPSYPTLSVYAPVYPFNVVSIYPDVPNGQKSSLHIARVSHVVVRLAPMYPLIEIYAPVYPHHLENIYPAISQQNVVPPEKAVLVRLVAGYPAMEMYPAVYPWNLQWIYPIIHVREIDERRRIHASTWRLPAHYPAVQPYPDAYPYLSIYPPRTLLKKRDNKDEKGLVRVRLPVTYPSVEIYAPVYPYNLSKVYPLVSSSSSSPTQASISVTVTLPSFYPFLNVYPGVYPHITIYPARVGSTQYAPLHEVGCQAILTTNAPHKPGSTYANRHHRTHSDLVRMVFHENAGIPEEEEISPFEPEYHSQDSFVSPMNAFLFPVDDIGEAYLRKDNPFDDLGITPSESMFGLDSSAVRRFALARQRELQTSNDISDEDSLYDEMERVDVNHIPPRLLGLRSSIKADIPTEASQYDDEVDASLFEHHARSSMARDIHFSPYANDSTTHDRVSSSLFESESLVLPSINRLPKEDIRSTNGGSQYAKPDVRQASPSISVRHRS